MTDSLFKSDLVDALQSQHRNCTHNPIDAILHCAIHSVYKTTSKYGKVDILQDIVNRTSQDVHSHTSK